MYAGIDLGGTNLKVGICDGDGHMLAAEKTPVPAFETSRALAEILTRAVEAAAGRVGLSAAALQGVGIGVPGAVRGGEVIYTCNLPLRNVPLGPLVEEQLGCPVLLGNDADCAAVGEYFCGAGRGTRNFMIMTLGTGIGGGMILNGALYSGAGMAGEVGHMVLERDGLPCSCGRRGCWEVYASATGLVRMTDEAIRQDPHGRLAQLAAAAGGTDARIAFEAEAEGDPTGQAVCRRYRAYLADGITNLVNILQPEVLAIGGGISAEREERLVQPVRERVERDCYAAHGGVRTRIVRAELGNDAGIIGAALLHRLRETCGTGRNRL